VTSARGKESSISTISQRFRIGILGSDPDARPAGRACGYWPTGYAAVLTAAGAVPVPLDPSAGDDWRGQLHGLHGVVLAGDDRTGAGRLAADDQVCLWCRDRALPLLAIDHGLHALNTTFGGSVYLDLPRECPEALQHRHPPEPGVRHAITVDPGTRLAGLYGEGEFAVNSEHRRAIHRLARGFRVSARALDGVIEAIEAESESWFALGVQWQPASATASGLDIQLFRGLVEACQRRGRFAARRRRSRSLAGVA
jgi:putative glutamine amidotransferase